MTDYDTIPLIPTKVEYQDVKQEAELRKLELGLTDDDISLRIIYNELASTDRILYYGIYNANMGSNHSIPWEQEGNDLAVIERLIDWALEQRDDIQSVILSFLDEEDQGKKEESLPHVLHVLGISPAEMCEEAQQTKSMTMADIMRRALPATKDELIALIQKVSVETKRPAATVRQFLRTDTRKGKIYLGSDDRYYHV